MDWSSITQMMEEYKRLKLELAKKLCVANTDGRGQLYGGKFNCLIFTLWDWNYEYLDIKFNTLEI